MAYMSTSLNKEILLIDKRTEKIGLTRGGYLTKSRPGTKRCPPVNEIDQL